MSSISRTQPSDAGVVHAAERASAHGQDTRRQDLDAEDRRWQLEWRDATSKIDADPGSARSLSRS